MKKKFLDVEDLSRLWKYHKETVRLMIRKGTLKPVDPDPPFLFSMAEIGKMPRPKKVGRPKGSRKSKPQEGGDKE